MNDEAALQPGTRRATGYADPVELGQRSDQRDEGRAAESDAQIQQAAGPVTNREIVSREADPQKTIRMFSFVKSLHADARASNQPHQAEKATRERWSIAKWFRTRN